MKSVYLFPLLIASFFSTASNSETITFGMMSLQKNNDCRIRLNGALDFENVKNEKGRIGHGSCIIGFTRQNYDKYFQFCALTEASAYDAESHKCKINSHFIGGAEFIANVTPLNGSKHGSVSCWFSCILQPGIKPSSSIFMSK